MSFDAANEQELVFRRMLKAFARSPAEAAALCAENLRQAGYLIAPTRSGMCAANRPDQEAIGLAASLGEPICAAVVVSAARAVAKDGFAAAVWLLDGTPDESDVCALRPPSALLGVSAASGIADAAVECEPAVHIFADVTGFTAHGARPHLGVNAVDAACLAACAVHALPLPPFSPAVVRILSIDAGKSSINMIPDQVSMLVEARGDEQSALETLAARIGRAVQSAAEALGATAAIKTRPARSAVCAALARALPGASAVSAPPYTSGRGETLALARYLQCESAYLRIPNADDETRRGAAYANVLRRGAARLREAAERSANHA